MNPRVQVFTTNTRINYPAYTMSTREPWDTNDKQREKNFQSSKVGPGVGPWGTPDGTERSWVVRIL